MCNHAVCTYTSFYITVQVCKFKIILNDQFSTKLGSTTNTIKLQYQSLQNCYYIRTRKKRGSNLDVALGNVYYWDKRVNAV